MDYFSIKINFNQTCEQAKELEDCAAQMKSLADQKMAGFMQEMASAWSGECSAGYLAKSGIVKSNMLETAEKLNSIAQTIRIQAKRTYDAEMRALALAKKRKSGGGGSL